MSDIFANAKAHFTNRRSFLLGGGVALACATAPPFRSAAVAADKSLVAPTLKAAGASDTQLLLLGTGGGPTWWPNSNRSGISSAIKVGDAIYIVDCGEGVGKRLQEALRPKNALTTMSSVRALFLTHLHSDHTIDYQNLLLYGLYSGLDRPSQPLKVFGPGRRGQMEPVFTVSGASTPSPEIVNPENPTPGIVDMTNYLTQAFATDLNDRIRDNGKRSLKELLDVTDITIPPIDGFRSPNETPSPDMEPFKVFEDDKVRVTATLVNHFPVWPAFAYRFDTDDGAVVFSGDTSPNRNLIRLATGADILVHEVIVTDFADNLFPAPRSPSQEGLRNHLLNAHTPVEQVGRLAESAGVSTLVLSHIVPGNASAAQLAPAQNGFSGKLVIGEDLMTLEVNRSSARAKRG